MSLIRQFRRIVLAHFEKSGRTFPWRNTRDPYAVLVSEVMLQQTQTSHVAPFYRRFLKRFPTVRVLAKASLADVYAAWAGLGYNRRAKYLRDAAKEMEERHGGNVPQDFEELRKLPGIGSYTAAAIRAFAWNLPAVFLETNIRTAYIHHFFSDTRVIADRELLPLIEATLDKKDPRRWYSALMDYGAHIKERGVRINRKSAHYVRQKPFQGSVRQARGKILRALDKPRTARELSQPAGAHTGAALAALLRDGLIEKHGNHYQLSR